MKTAKELVEKYLDNYKNRKLTESALENLHLAKLRSDIENSIEQAAVKGHREAVVLYEIPAQLILELKHLNYKMSNYDASRSCYATRISW